MNVSATAVRVLTQLRRDPRSLALVLLVPCVLEGLLKAMFADEPQIFQKIGPPLLGLFPFISMFLITSVTMLRERTSGTLERLMTMPIRKLDLLGGYGVAFGLLAAVQAAIVSAVAFGLLGLNVVGPEWAVAALAVGNAVLGMALGPAGQRVRDLGVPGRAVHAGDRAPAAAAVRAVRQPRRAWRGGCRWSLRRCP